MLAGRRICITGGAGFIGSHLLERLLPKNRVVIFDNFHRDALTLSGLASHPEVEIVRGDVLDADAVTKAVAGCDAVVHLASIAGVDTVLRNPVLTMKVSLLGTYHALEAARWTVPLRPQDFSFTTSPSVTCFTMCGCALGSGLIHIFMA